MEYDKTVKCYITDLTVVFLTILKKGGDYA